MCFNSLAAIAGKINFSEYISEYKEYLTTLDWGQVATVVIAGVVIVLVVLFVLIGIFYAFGNAVSKSVNAAGKKKADADAPADQPVPLKSTAQIRKPAPAPVSSPPAVEQGISGEVVAAIAAAVSECEGGAPVRIRSIRVRKADSRNPWAAAAMRDNAMPF